MLFGLTFDFVKFLPVEFVAFEAENNMSANVSSVNTVKQVFIGWIYKSGQEVMEILKVTGADL